MEAITIAGLAVLAAGGYYSIIDFLNDLGMCGKGIGSETGKSATSQHSIGTHQAGIKKMTGMYI